MLLKKSIFFISLFLIFSFGIKPNWGEAKVIVISDIDDTIKVAYIKDIPKLISNYFKGADAFVRLVDIYWDMKEHLEKKGESVEFFYLTAALSIFDMGDWLRNHNLPVGLVKQKPLSDAFMSTFDYKIAALKNFLHEKSKTVVIGGKKIDVYLFGDSGQQDAYVYDAIFKDQDLKNYFNFFPYIRVVYSIIPDLKNVQTFKTEADLIGNGPLSELVSTNLKEEILKDKKENKLTIIAK